MLGDRSALPTVAAVVGAGVVVSLNVGKVPPALPVLREVFELDLVAASLLVSMLQFAGMLLGLVGGMLADRLGPRRVMRTGLLVAALGSAAGGFANSASALLVSRALESVGFLFAVLPGPALLVRNVSPARVRAALGLWGAYLPAGFALGLALSPIAYQTVGWRPVWWTVAVACAAMAMLLGAVVPADRATGVVHGALQRVRDTLSAPRAWVLSAAFACYAAQWIGLFAFLPTVYAEIGVPLALAGTLTAVAVAVNVVGNLAAGVLLQRGIPRATLIGVTAVAMAAGAALCFGTDAPLPVRYVGVLLFSTVGGLIPGTLFASTAAYAPYPGAIGTTTGLIQQGSALAQFVSPPLVAAACAALGGWHAIAWTTAAFSLGVLALSRVIARIDRRIAASFRA